MMCRGPQRSAMNGNVRNAVVPEISGQNDLASRAYLAALRGGRAERPELHFY
jgi:hypothetical protein